MVRVRGRVRYDLLYYVDSKAVRRWRVMRAVAGWVALAVAGMRRLRTVGGFEAWRASIWRNFAWHSSAKVNGMGPASSPLLYSAKAKPTLGEGSG